MESMAALHKSFNLDIDGCKFGRAVESNNYLYDYANKVTSSKDRNSLKRGTSPNFNNGVFYTPLNRQGISGRIPDYYSYDSELRFGALYMIDFSNLMYSNPRLNNENIIEFLEILIAKHYPVATGSLISGSQIGKPLIDKLVDLGFCVYNENRKGREITVDAQIMYHITDIINDSRRYEPHYIRGLRFHYPHYNCLVIITSDYNNDNIASFPMYIREVARADTVYHYDTFEMEHKPKNKAELDHTASQLYNNLNVGEIIDLMKKPVILLPTFSDLSIVSHELVINNGYYYIGYDGGYVELNQHLIYLNQVWFSRLDVYELAQSQLLKN
jgi:hypothetical protein